MKILYELNPPKIVNGKRFDLAQLNEGIKSMADRARQLVGLVEGIHLTDSVLGVPRVSGVTAAGQIRKALDGLDAMRLSCSVRVRDRNFTSLCQVVSDAILTGVDSLLILLGDEPAGMPGASGLVPSAAVKKLKKEGYHSKIKFDLSFPARVSDCSKKSVQCKLDAGPDSFVTQSISSLSDLGDIVDLSKSHGIKVSAVIMVPSSKNRQSAAVIGLDWSGYEKCPVDFVKKAASLADRVLLTSPSSFTEGLELLRQLR